MTRVGGVSFVLGCLAGARFRGGYLRGGELGYLAFRFHLDNSKLQGWRVDSK
jgi:hypothetical protein